MARSLTLGALVTRCQQRSVREGDSQIDPTEFKALISEKYGEMHALVSEKGARYFQTEIDINLAALTLPTDWQSTYGVDFVLSGTTGPRRALEGPIAVQDRTRLIGLTTGGPAFYFGLEAGSLALYPSPSSGSYKHLYLPQPTDLSTGADSTSVDLINVYGEKFVLWGVAAIALYKGNDAQDRALAEESKARAELEYWACQIALTHAPRRHVGDAGTGRMPDPADWRWSR